MEAHKRFELADSDTPLASQPWANRRGHKWNTPHAAALIVTGSTAQAQRRTRRAGHRLRCGSASTVTHIGI